MTSKDSVNSFGARDTLEVGDNSYQIYRLDAVPNTEKLPYSLKVLAENLLRNEDGSNITKDHIEAIANWDPKAEPSIEIQYTPARVVMQDFTGVPCIVDLATMREAIGDLGGNPEKVNPLAPADLVIDHSVIADLFGTADAFERNVEIEYQRNGERYQFLRWGQGAFDDFKVVPPGTGIVHQVNIEYLASVVMTRDGVAYPDTCVGTDSHTTMVNGLGVLGWGVGGIEAEAAMLGQPVSMLIPRVVGFKLTGEIQPGVTATDVVLTVTEMLRKHGVVGKFVEFYGEGRGRGAVGQPRHPGQHEPRIRFHRSDFPDRRRDHRLPEVHRPQADEQLALVEAYAKEQGMWHDPKHEPAFSEYLELDLSEVVPSIAGPKRPQDRIALSEAKSTFRKTIPNYVGDDPDKQDYSKLDEDGRRDVPGQRPRPSGERPRRRRAPVHSAAAHAKGRVSNPVPVKSDELRRIRARPRRGGDRRDHVVHQHLQPRGDAGRGAAGPQRRREGTGLQAVGENHDGAGLAGGQRLLRQGRPVAVSGEAGLLSGRLRLHHLHRQLRPAARRDLEGRQRQRPFGDRGAVRQPELRGPHQPRREDELPGLAAAGDRLRAGRDAWTSTSSRSRSAQIKTARTSILKDIWPSQKDVSDTIASAINQEMFIKNYADVFKGDERWRNLPTPSGNTFEWADGFDVRTQAPVLRRACPPSPEPVGDITGARVLALLGDSVTTDHISPASSIKPGTPAAQYLDEHGVERKDYNSFGSRRGNHEVMIRGTFANIRLRNQLLDDVSGGYTRDFTQDGAPQAFIYDAAQNYAAEDIPLVVLGGKEYGSGSSRDWAAKGTSLLGVRAVITESFERIHRSNLIGMGVIPLQFPEGKSAEGPWAWTAPRCSTSPGSRSSTTARRRRRCMSRPAKDGGERNRIRRGGAHRHPR